MTEHAHGPTGPSIHIDKKEYHAPKDAMTGAELRALAVPPIGEDRDLWREVPGAADVRVDDGDLVTLHNGEHFFSSPRTITPGFDAGRG
jgi:multiubiquitin